MTCIGSREAFNSYRSKLVGLVGASVTLRTLASCAEPPARLIIGCDGKAALSTITHNRASINSNLHHWDLISALKDIWESMGSVPLTTHVKGHQDEASSQLSRLERMNIAMDRLAKITATSYLPRDLNWTIAELGMPTVTIQGRAISQPLQQCIYSLITGSNIASYFSAKHYINTDTVHWESFATSQTKVSTTTNIFVTKWMSDTAPTGKILVKRRHSISSKCPRCGYLGEDREHVLVCWGLGAATIWEKGITALKNLMEEEKTHPDIYRFMIEGLSSYRKSPRQSTFIRHRYQWQQEVQDIGWLNILSGMLGRQVVQKQQDYYYHINSRKTGKNWGSRIILQLWTITHNMWHGRNVVEHNKQAIHNTIGVQLLDLEIEKEYDKGCHDLPITVHKWFHPSKEEILAKSVDYKKGWLVIVKSVKESQQVADYGIFSTSRTLRNWIGLRA
jgi:hypothetical protein